MEGKSEKTSTADLKRTSRKTFFEVLRDKIEILEGVSPEKVASEGIPALAFILQRFSRLAQSSQAKEGGRPRRKLFQQAMLCGAEIYKMLMEFAKLDPNDPNVNAVRAELLNLISRLEALLVNPGAKDLISDSLYQLALENKSRKFAAKIAGFESLDKVAKLYFIEMITLQKMILNEDFKKAWISFALVCSKTKENRQKMMHVLKFNSQNEIDSEWLNSNFIKIWQEDSNPEKVLNRLFETAKTTAENLSPMELDEKRKIIEAFEARIPEWSDPKRFDVMWKDYAKEIIPLIEKLNIQPGMTPLAEKAVLVLIQRLTDLMDRSIKSLEGSPEYTAANKKLQIERFIKLLEPYHQLMRKWMNQIPDSQYEDWAKYVNDFPEDNTKESMLKYIEACFSNLKLDKNLDVSQFNASRGFSVDAARVGTTASFGREFVAKSDRLTLEDLFSLMHQNILSSLSVLGQKSQIPLENLPDKLRPFMKAMSETTELVGTELQYPWFRAEFNLPMKNHSARFSLEYNQKDHKLRFKGSFFGVDHGYLVTRWASIKTYLGIAMQSFGDIELNFPAMSSGVTFNFECDEDRLLPIGYSMKDIIEDSMKLTFRGSLLSVLVPRIAKLRPDIDKQIAYLDGVPNDNIVLEQSQDSFIKMVLELLDGDALPDTKIKALIDILKRNNLLDAAMKSVVLNGNLKMMKLLLNSGAKLPSLSPSIVILGIAQSELTKPELKKWFEDNYLAKYNRSDFQGFTTLIKEIMESTASKEIKDASIAFCLDQRAPLDYSNLEQVSKLLVYPKVNERILKHFQETNMIDTFNRDPKSISGLKDGNFIAVLVKLGLDLQLLTQKQIMLALKDKSKILQDKIYSLLIDNTKTGKKFTVEVFMQQLLDSPPSTISGAYQLFQSLLKQTELKFTPVSRYFMILCREKPMDPVVIDYLRREYANLSTACQRDLKDWFLFYLNSNTEAFRASWPAIIKCLTKGDFEKIYKVEEARDFIEQNLLEALKGISTQDLKQLGDELRSADTAIKDKFLPIVEKYHEQSLAPPSSPRARQ